MLYEVTGDIVLTKAQALAHGIAPNDPFDQGLARALREQWPAMHRDYHHYAHQGRLRVRAVVVTVIAQMDRE